MTVIQCAACNFAREQRLQVIREHFGPISTSAHECPSNSGREWMFRLNFDSSYRSSSISTVSGSYTRECFLCGHILIRETWEFVSHSSHMNIHWFPPNVTASPHETRSKMSSWSFPSTSGSSSYSHHHSTPTTYQISHVNQHHSAPTTHQITHVGHHHSTPAYTTTTYQIGHVDAPSSSSVTRQGFERGYFNEVAETPVTTHYFDGPRVMPTESISRGTTWSEDTRSITPESLWLSNFGCRY